MPWCPKCRTEYIEGISNCSDCGTPLVEDLAPVETPEKFDESIETAFLISVGDKLEAEMLEDMLCSNGINVLKKHRESGAYLDVYMGMSSLGIDIYVPKEKLEQAKQLIKAENQTPVEDEMKELEEDYNKKRRFRAWIVILFFVPGLIFVLLGVLYMLFNR